MSSRSSTRRTVSTHWRNKSTISSKLSRRKPWTKNIRPQLQKSGSASQTSSRATPMRRKRFKSNTKIQSRRRGFMFQCIWQSTSVWSPWSKTSSKLSISACSTWCTENSICSGIWRPWRLSTWAARATLWRPLPNSYSTVIKNALLKTIHSTSSTTASTSPSSSSTTPTAITTPLTYYSQTHSSWSKTCSSSI